MQELSARKFHDIPNKSGLCTSNSNALEYPMEQIKDLVRGCGRVDIELGHDVEIVFVISAPVGDRGIDSHRSLRAETRDTIAERTSGAPRCRYRSAPRVCLARGPRKREYSCRLGIHLENPDLIFGQLSSRMLGYKVVPYP
jgi:hypothetical protein